MTIVSILLRLMLRVSVAWALLISAVLSVARLRTESHVLAYNHFDPINGSSSLVFVDPGYHLRSETPRRDSLYRDMMIVTGRTAPDGVTQVVSRPTQSGIDLFIQAGDASLRRLTDARAFPADILSVDKRRSNTAPVWSAGGEWIAFVSSDTSGRQDVFIIRPDGRTLRRVAFDVGSTVPLTLRWVVIVPRQFPGLIMTALFGLLWVTIDRRNATPDNTGT